MEGSVATLTFESRRQPRPGNVPVTCIGMSAGGIQPLKTIFRELPADSGMAFIVVHHIRKVPTQLPEILSTCTNSFWRLRETDGLVAFTFAGMAMDTLEEGKSGLMTAIDEGRYAMAPIPDPKLGPRNVDIKSMYNTECYCPQYKHKIGLPIFLTRP
jgi:CheB methylesterase